MNRDWFGDSYDIVKRFFVGALRSLGYTVHVDPMPTGDWESTESAFLEFLGARHIREAQSADKSALFLDPDTGIAARQSRRHTSIPSIASHLERHAIVFVFDQSFSRSADSLPQLQAKLRELHELGAQGFYYNSHARFLFSSLSAERLRALHEALLKAGLPAHRLISLGTNSA
ncbi:MAG: hypothetical protein ACOYXU_04550 [Nitrospirota bacterium]